MSRQNNLTPKARRFRLIANNICSYMRTGTQTTGPMALSTPTPHATEPKGSVPRPLVSQELAVMILDGAGGASLTGYALALALAFVLRHQAPAGVLAGWLAVMSVLLVLRLVFFIRYRRARLSSVEAAVSRLYRPYTVTVGLFGAGWGCGGLLLFPEGSPLHQLALTFLVAGLTAGAVPILAADIKLFRGYILAALLPLTTQIFLEGGEVYAVLTLALLLYIFMLLMSAGKMHQALVSALETRFFNESLNRDLVAEIGQRQAAEEKLLRAKDRVEAASLAKSEFLANMSHEIRTPMNGILGTLQLLLHTHLDPTQKEYVAVSHASAQGLLAILNDILDFSKIEAGKLELEQIPFDLRETVAALTALFAEQSEKKQLTITTEIDDRVPATLLGDPGRVRQIIANLLSNAIKFTPAGTIAIRLQVLKTADDTSVIRLEVRDTGIGIEPRHLDRLFESFTQADGSTTRKYGGTGLGLTIVMQLCELMGGEIGVASTFGQGSSFWCDIPFATVVDGKGAGGRTGHGTAVQPLPAILHGQILLVEDNPVNQMVARRMLDRLGLEYRCANNGEEALALLDLHHFDLVLMDCQMPGMDGFDATRLRRKKEHEEGKPRTPIVAMTANAMKGDRERCLEAGMDDYIAKPVKLPVLQETLQRWLRHKISS